MFHFIISPLSLEISLDRKDESFMSNITGDQRTCYVPQSLKSATSAQHMSAWIYPLLLCVWVLVDSEKGVVGISGNHIQVRDSHAFISITGHVKVTWLYTVLMHTKGPWPLNGLPAGLFMVMGFSHAGALKNEDPVLWQIIFHMAELHHLYCTPLFYFEFLCLCSNNGKCILIVC